MNAKFAIIRAYAAAAILAGLMAKAFALAQDSEPELAAHLAGSHVFVTFDLHATWPIRFRT